MWWRRRYREPLPRWRQLQPTPLGVVVRGDLEGFFLIIMISLLDTFLENPVDNPLGNKPC